MLEQLVPPGPPTTVDTMLAELAEEPKDGALRVGDERVVAFVRGLARRLVAGGTVRAHPELGALGFFLRRLDVAAPAAGTVLYPRGLVLHVPPVNVDTLFVYSWALSALAGNRNVVRLSPRAGAAARALLELLGAELAQAHPAVAHTQRVIRYDRDEAVTAALSLACDLRVVWGGDDTVRAIRAHPLRPDARDLAFPDRSSFAAISVPWWHAADPGARRRTAAALAADAYWFDQAACASPRALFLIGGSTVDAFVVREGLFPLVAAEAEQRGWGRDPAMAVQRRVEAYGLAATGAATRIREHGPSVTEVLLADAAPPRRWLGAGLFPVVELPSLDDLAALVVRRDQTLTHAGFAPAELAAFAERLGGRGLDRIVPIGSALAFSPLWDGYDLRTEFTRRATLR